MKLESCIKNRYGKCDTPENTIKRLESAIGALYEWEYLEEKVSDYLYWSLMVCHELGWQSMGKGISPIMCKAGALAEFAEAAGWLTGDEVVRLPGYVAAHQDDLEDPLRIEDLLSHVSSATPSVLEKIKKLDSAQHWVDGYSLMDDRTLKVPIEYVRLISWGNGHAAGNRMEEALDHAANEVFERRAQITVVKNRMVVPTIDVDTIDNPIIQSQIDFVRSRDIELYIKDLSFGGELPCIGVYFLDHNIPGDYQFKHFFKVGSSFDKEDALIRCFTEYTQYRRRQDFIRGSEEEQKELLERSFRNLKCMGDDGDNFLSSWMFGMLPYADASFLREGDVIAFDGGDCFDDFLEDLEKAKEVCGKLGKDCIAVDFTDPDIGFPAVQVIIPGYSDILPYYPQSSEVSLFRRLPRDELLDSYERGPGCGFTFYNCAMCDGSCSCSSFR